MAKNKGKFGKGKSDIEETDEFVSSMSRLATKLKPHALRIGLLVAGVSIALIAFGVYSWYKERKHKAATTQFDAAALISQARIVAPDDAPDPDVPPEPQEDEPPEFPSAKERAEATLAELDRLGSQYGSTGVSKESVLMRANAMLVLGRFDEARALYAEYASTGDVPELKLVAREGVGYALEEKALAAGDAAARQKALQEALDAFAQMQPKEDGARRDHALFHQGRILAMLDRKQEAIEKYEQVLALDDTPLKLEVENRLAALEAGGD